MYCQQSLPLKRWTQSKSERNQILSKRKQRNGLVFETEAFHAPCVEAIIRMCVVERVLRSPSKNLVFVILNITYDINLGEAENRKAATAHRTLSCGAMGLEKQEE